ncbi:Golgi GDP-mannose transporter [Trichoderma parareesei]|uniref:Dihydroorotate dehydrogenase (fumarate) n=1 Tax=Trichoderma parareesei TaxID=858221 RepID=A0A2H2ZF42_TRIPA|nr:Golgi GDP-mannose transporter [Trichoderma parareesei]
MPPKLHIHPPLLNTASPWSTSRSHLAALLRCPSLGAVTTRTSLLSGFPHDPSRNRYAFFDPAAGAPLSVPGNNTSSSSSSTTTTKSSASTTFSGPPDDSLVNDVFRTDIPTDKLPIASLNTLGYSSLPLSEYLSIISSFTHSPPSSPKTIIISITGSPSEISSSYALISSFSHSPQSPSPFPLAIEINLSCPNIPNLPPPAYSPASLATYLAALPTDSDIPIGIKIPPYTYAGQFDDFVSALLGSHSPFSPTSSSSSSPPPPSTSTSSAIPVPASKLSFITATNTLGSSLLIDTASSSSTSPGPLLPDAGIGGMAGPPLHPLALGNVSNLRRRFDADPRLVHLDIIGVGGVYDGQGYKRMRSVGAMAVGIATALGRQGMDVFTSIEKDINSAW